MPDNRGMARRQWQQAPLERLLLGFGCFVLGSLASEEYRRWGRRLLCEKLGIDGIVA